MRIDFSQVITAEARALEARQIEARAYLAATDWMAARKAETGKEIPEDVAKARSAAREILSEVAK